MKIEVLKPYLGEYQKVRKRERHKLNRETNSYSQCSCPYKYIGETERDESENRGAKALSWRISEREKEREA